MSIRQTTRKIGFAACISISPFAMGNQDARSEIGGILSAANQAVLSVGISARVERLPLTVGESFEPGDTLVHLDCETQRAQSELAEAAYQAAKSRYDQSKQQPSYNPLDQYDIRLARADLVESAAYVRLSKSSLKQCAVKAPYAGRIAELNISVNERAAAGQPLMRILGTQALELKLIVPSNWLSWMRPGTRFRFVVTELGKRYWMVVREIGAEVDADSGTVSIVGRFTQQPKNALPGMSGTAQFTLPERLVPGKQSPAGVGRLSNDE